MLDAFGHVSIRNPENSSTFFMSCSIAPALISSKDDLVEYHMGDASPVVANAKEGYSERFIHSEILKRFPGANIVIHSHSPDVLPYCVNDVPLKPSIHMSGFLGTQLLRRNDL